MKTIKTEYEFTLPAVDYYGKREGEAACSIKPTESPEVFILEVGYRNVLVTREILSVLVQFIDSAVKLSEAMEGAEEAFASVMSSTPEEEKTAEVTE